jgi:hypothetical protein
MIEPEEKKAVPESDNPADRRRIPDRRSGVTDRRIKPDRRESITDGASDNSKDRRVRPDRRIGVIDRRIQPSKRRSITDEITDYRIRQNEGVKPKKKWYEKIFPSKSGDE